MEELLNKLIKKGWKPFGIEGIVKVDMSREHYGIDFENSRGYALASEISPRQLTSKESGLWQFCIANHLLKKYSDLGDDDEYVIGRWQNGMDGKTTDGEYIDENYDSDIYHQDESYQRWLIESALKDESELEDFLLQNIKLDGE